MSDGKVYIMSEDRQWVMMNLANYEGFNFPLMRWSKVQEMGMEEEAMFATEYNDNLQRDCVHVAATTLPYCFAMWAPSDADADKGKTWVRDYGLTYGRGGRAAGLLFGLSTPDGDFANWDTEPSIRPSISRRFVFVPVPRSDSEYVLK